MLMLAQAPAEIGVLVCHGRLRLSLCSLQRSELCAQFFDSSHQVRDQCQRFELLNAGLAIVANPIFFAGDGKRIDPCASCAIRP